jgi:hypothetical protein
MPSVSRHPLVPTILGEGLLQRSEQRRDRPARTARPDNSRGIDEDVSGPDAAEPFRDPY